MALNIKYSPKSFKAHAPRPVLQEQEVITEATPAPVAEVQEQEPAAPKKKTTKAKSE